MTSDEFTPAFSTAFDPAAASLSTTACDWPVSYAEGSSCTALDTAPDKALFEQMAIDYLSAFTGHAFGLCPAVVRPCREQVARPSTFWGRGPYPAYAAGGGGSGYVPVLVGGSWFNLGCGICGSSCSCTERSRCCQLAVKKR